MFPLLAFFEMSFRSKFRSHACSLFAFFQMTGNQALVFLSNCPHFIDKLLDGYVAGCRQREWLFARDILELLFSVFFTAEGEYIRVDKDGQVRSALLLQGWRWRSSELCPSALQCHRCNGIQALMQCMLRGCFVVSVARHCHAKWYGRRAMCYPVLNTTEVTT